MKRLVKFDVLTNVTCTNGKKHINKTKMLLSIDMVCITRNIQSEITKRSEDNNIRECVTADELIGLSNDVDLKSETKCDRKMTTSTQYLNAPWLLTILSSSNAGTNLLFNELPMIIRMCKFFLYLLGVIIKDASHFRSMLHIQNDTWVSYDGLDSNYEIIDLQNKDSTFV